MRTESHPRTQFIFSAVTLFFVLTGVYLLTYRGFPLSVDEYHVYDMAESLVNRGNFYRTYEFTRANPTVLEGTPWGDPILEPAMPLVVAPVFAIGQAAEHVGTVHVVWLTNIFITGLVAVSLFAGAHLLGYSPGVAWTLGLLYGLTTLAWPYSRHLFREPLMAFFTLWCFILGFHIQKVWREGRLPWRAGLLLVGSFTGVFLTKAMGVMLVPPLLILLSPAPNILFRRRRMVIVSGIAACAFVAIIAGILLLDTGRSRYSFNIWLDLLRRIEWQYIIESLLGYHISPGRSLWLYSPVLLVSLYGVRLLVRQKQWRMLFAPAAFIFILSAVYGIGHRTSWWGSWGWGPRYMLPLVPVIMLFWMLPVLPHLRTTGRRMSFGVLAALSAALQLLGMSVNLPNYYTDLNWAGLLTDWSTQPTWAAYNWRWEWSPIKYHLDRLDFNHLDFAWRMADPVWIGPLLALLLAVAGGGLYVYFSRRYSPRARYGFVLVLALPLITLITIVGGLRSLRDDPRYTAEWPDVRALIAQLNQLTTRDEIIFVDREEYLRLFMNDSKTGALTAILPYAPGENYGSYEPLVTGDDTAALAGEEAAYALDWSANHYATLWLVASSGPFDTEKRRPIERYLVENYFPITEVSTSPRARAARFLTVDAPQGIPTHSVDIAFESGLSLSGFDLPTGTTFAPGDIVPVSLVWTPHALIPEDFNVSVQIATPDGVPVVQRDGVPQGTFGHMTQWETGGRYRDNHGLQLPRDLSPGNYQLQVIVYRWQDGKRLRYTTENLQGDVAKLAEITVHPAD